MKLNTELTIDVNDFKHYLTKKINLDYIYDGTLHKLIIEFFYIPNFKNYDQYGWQYFINEIYGITKSNKIFKSLVTDLKKNLFILEINKALTPKITEQDLKLCKILIYSSTMIHTFSSVYLLGCNIQLICINGVCDLTKYKIYKMFMWKQRSFDKHPCGYKIVSERNNVFKTVKKELFNGDYNYELVYKTLNMIQ